MYGYVMITNAIMLRSKLYKGEQINVVKCEAMESNDGVTYFVMH
jgi:hypothetical protein